MTATNSETTKIALVYDHLITPYGGAEKVLQILLKAYPNAQLYTTVFDQAQAAWVDPQRVTAVTLPRFIQKLLHKREILDLCAPFLLEHHDLSQYDVVLSITATAAKGILTAPNQQHISYILSPPRYLYHQSRELLANHTLLRLPLLKQLAQVVLSYLRWWDQAAAHRPDTLVTLSEVVSKRILKVYQRKADAVIYPPVEPAVRRKSAHTFQPYLLVLSRLVPYKRIDLCIKAAKLLQLPLVIAGTGSEQVQLIHAAGQATRVRKHESVEELLFQLQSNSFQCIFLNTVTAEEKATLLQHASILLMPGIEDFGITALEAVTYQVPVVLHAHSGVSEVLTDAEYVQITSQDVAAVTEAITAAQELKISNKRATEIETEHSVDAFVRKLHNLVFSRKVRRARISQKREDL